MQIVIDISEEIMEYIKNNDCLAVAYGDEVAKAIKNGTPLPKGHGDLIDADVLKKNICKWLKPSVPDESMLVDIAEVGADVCKEIEEQPTIIDADKDSD